MADNMRTTNDVDADAYQLTLSIANRANEFAPMSRRLGDAESRASQAIAVLERPTVTAQEWQEAEASLKALEAACRDAAGLADCFEEEGQAAKLRAEGLGKECSALQTTSGGPSVDECKYEADGARADAGNKLIAKGQALKTRVGWNQGEGDVVEQLKEKIKQHHT